MKKKIISINPATLKEIGRVDQTPVSAIPGMVEKAEEAWLLWRDKTLAERRRVLRRAKHLLLERKDEVALTITREMGRPLGESLGLEVQASLDVLSYYVTHAGRLLNDRRQPLHHPLFLRRESRMIFQPLGVLGMISPWNWPLLIPLGSVVPALLSGNAVLLKPSEFTSLVAQRMRQIFIEAGLPEDVFQLVFGGEEQGRALVDSGVKKIFFTGSTKVGGEIYRHAAARLKKCVLEMGGSDAAIVCGDADIEYTSSGIVWGGFSNCGQNCNGIERVFVDSGIFNVFLDRLIEKTRTLRLGEGESPFTDIGPLANQEQLRKIEKIVKRSLAEGDRIITGGNALRDRPGYFFEPTVILRRAEKAREEMDEVFGPIVFVTPVRDDEEAVRLANSSRYGLSATIWAGDKKRGRRLARLMESGTVMINDAIVSFGMPEAGWTGLKDSGIGWVHGEKGLDEMLNVKYINRDPQDRRKKLWWFPYREETNTALSESMRLLFSKNLSERLKALFPVVRKMGADMLLNRPVKDRL